MFDILNQNLEFLKDVGYTITRKNYLALLDDFSIQNNIIIITGLRRSGKSSILLNFLQNKPNIFYFSKEIDPRNQIVDNKKILELFEYYISKYGEPEYIAIDEIQDIINWEYFIRYIYALKKYKIIITGSNSKLLSGEFATYLAGRYFEIQTFPLSMKEYLFFKKVDFNDNIFQKYLIYGSLPEIVLLNNPQLQSNYLNVIKDSIIFKDIVTRYSIKEIFLYHNLLKYISINIGQYTTGRNINGFLKKEGINLALSTMLDYINHTENAFIIHKVNRFDIKGKKILEINNKYYFSDLGIRNSILSTYSTKDISQLLENFVYNSLKIHGYEVYIGNIQQYEIDFIALKNGITKYFQVAYLLQDSTYDREINNLLMIKDSYEKFIVTLDQFRLGNDRGVKIISILDFLDII